MMEGFKDQERAEYIYKARKYDKRTYADIGRELGITGTRVRQIYRRLDWMINRYEADHHKKKANGNGPEEENTVIRDIAWHCKRNDDGAF